MVNPFAGMGGALGLKGTDGRALDIALARGAKPVSPIKAKQFLEACMSLNIVSKLVFLTAGGDMGVNILSKYTNSYRVVYEPRKWPTSRDDTFRAVYNCLEKGVEMIVFVGGDGTARDVVEAMRSYGAVAPLLGVPAGVKMYSSIFAVSPRAAAFVLADWLKNGRLCSGEIVDVDEEAFRRDKLVLKLYGVVETPCSSMIVGVSKQPTPDSEKENIEAIARYIIENMDECTLYILGPGSTVKEVARLLGVDYSLLGVDVIHNGRLVVRDVDEERLYRLVVEHLARGGKAKIIVTPIGGQGFIFGRGNQQISPRIIRLVGRENIIVVSSRSKLRRLKLLRVDTGDTSVDELLRGYIRVVVDYGEEEVRRVE